MNVVVMNRNNAKRFSFQPHDFKSAIISITDIRSYPNQFNKDHSNGIVEICALSFDDVNRGEQGCITEEDAEKIVKFVRRIKDKVDTVIVHCEAGQSRSAGVAAAILKYYTGHDEQIYNDPKYTPNSTCYRRVLEAFYESEENI